MTEEEMVGWHHQLNGQDLSKLQDKVKGKEAWCAAVHGAAKRRRRLRGRTAVKLLCNMLC